MSRRRRLVLAVTVLLLLSVGIFTLTPTKFRFTPPENPATPASTTVPSTGTGETIAAPSPPTAATDSASISSTGSPPPPPAAPPANAAGNPPENSVRALAAQGKTVASILADADMEDPEIRARKVAELKLLEEAQHNAVTAKANELGIPLRKDGPGHKVSILYDIRGEEPLYRTTLNANAAITTGANLVAAAPYNLDGTGVKIGIWDGGSVRSTHQELTGRVTLRNSRAAVDDHATHVAGTIGATGVQSAAKGMAPKATIDSYDWNSDYAEMTAAGAASAGAITSIPLSNHSYGYDAATADMGRYETEAAAVDAVAASMPYYLPFWAAGNEQDELTALGGYQSITFNGLAKNVITIGAVDDAITSGVRDTTKAAIAYFSSLGPCDDGRIKPDVVANGINLYSSVATSNTAYDSTYSGTSMATPNALGSSILLEQLYAREFSGQRLRASMLKALLIHTADDLGNPGPDYTYGWGLINVKTASDVIIANKASLAAPKMIEGTLTAASSSKTHTFTWDGVSPIRATLCWTDPAGNTQTGADSRTANLKHNLDAKITTPNGTTVYQPYVMPFVGTWTQASMALNATTGKNNVDTVEQVYLAAPSLAGVYTVSISLDGSLTTASQAYSLIITGGTNLASNPPPSVALTSPADGTTFLPAAPITISATATDLTVGGVAGAVTQVEFFAGTTSLGIDTTAPYSVNWTPATGGIYVIAARATDNEAAVATSAAATVTVLSGDGTPAVSSFTPTSGTAGSLVILSGSNFAGITAVRFNGVDAAYTVDSLGQITASIPALATTGAIAVVSTHGTGTSSTVFTIVQSPVLISQIYGGGGNNGATYRNDYVELYNRSDATVSLAGWSLQYSSASGTTWSAANLSGSIAAGKYCLISLASGGPFGSSLPTADVIGGVNISSSNGKLALRNSTTAFTGSSPLGAAGLQDFVGYGNANAYEGSATAASHSVTLAAFRAGAGATDTGDNAADFSIATANPRNSATGPAVTPVITSAATATITEGNPFVYQITASNSPTSFGATGLPAGLTIATTSGAITGAPVTAGTATITLSATNAAGTGSASLELTINPATAGGDLFSENMGTGNGTTSIATNVFQNSGILTFAGTADVRTSSASSSYTGASGGKNVFFNSTSGLHFEISGINTTGYTGLELSLGHYKSTTTGSNELVIETSPDGTTYTPLTYTRPTGSGTTTWLEITPTGTIPSVANLHLRFRQTSSTSQFRIDDVTLTGTATGGGNPTFANWLAGYNVGTFTHLNDDPDHDGLPNGIENLLGTAPDRASPGLSSAVATATTLVFRHTRSNTPASDLAASYEWSTDLTNWHPSATTDNGTTVTFAVATVTDTNAPANDLVEVTATVTGTTKPKIFARLKAVK